MYDEQDDLRNRLVVDADLSQDEQPAKGAKKKKKKVKKAKKNAGLSMSSAVEEEELE
jgi:hypothetical protein